MKAKTTVILAAGDFPRKGGFAESVLIAADRVVACDSAAQAFFRRYRRWPEVIIGDMDSASRRGLASAKAVARLVHIADQDTNDLEKAAEYCRSRRWKVAAIVGASGKREDHTIGNVFRALRYNLTMISDYGRFVPVCGGARLRTSVGAGVSIFATDLRTHVTSRGLKWPLDDVKFENLYCATLNRATARQITIRSDRPIMVYLEGAENGETKR